MDKPWSQFPTVFWEHVATPYTDPKFRDGGLVKEKTVLKLLQLEDYGLDTWNKIQDIAYIKEMDRVYELASEADFFFDVVRWFEEIWNDTYLFTEEEWTEKLWQAAYSEKESKLARFDHVEVGGNLPVTIMDPYYIEDGDDLPAMIMEPYHIEDGDDLPAAIKDGDNVPAAIMNPYHIKGGGDLPASKPTASKATTEKKYPKRGERGQQRRWTEAEKLRAIHHMTAAVAKETALKLNHSEGVFDETAAALVAEGYKDRTGSSVKNWWNRQGRAKSGLDERSRARANTLVTSARAPKKPKDKSLDTTAPSDKKRKRPSDQDESESEDTKDESDKEAPSDKKRKRLSDQNGSESEDTEDESEKAASDKKSKHLSDQDETESDDTIVVDPGLV